MDSTSKIRSFLAAARVPNLPGVACHVITGALLASWHLQSAQAIDWERLAISACAGVLLGLAGNLLNDWHDRAWDAKYRPERALPSGHFHPAIFLAIGIGALLLGVAVMFLLNPLAGTAALAIAVCVVIYTRCHKQTIWSVVPLALCRGLLPAMGALAAADGPLETGTPAWWLIVAFGAALVLWVCGLSLDARGESTGGARRSPLPWFLLLSAPMVLAFACVRISGLPWFAVLPVVLWLALVRGPFRHTPKHRVSALLAGLPLLDFLVLASAWAVTPAAPPHWILWIPLLAFALGRTLQRAASAT